MVRFPDAAGDFSFLHNVQIGSEAPIASYSLVLLGGGGFKPHPPQAYKAEVKNEGIYTPTTPNFFRT